MDRRLRILPDEDLAAPPDVAVTEVHADPDAQAAVDPPAPAEPMPEKGEIPAGTVNPMVIPLQGAPCRFGLRPDGGQDLYPCRPLRAASRATAPGITVLSMRVSNSPLPPQRVGAIVRVAEGDDGVFLNFCPFCGENIHRNFKRIARELKSRGQPPLDSPDD